MTDDRRGVIEGRQFLTNIRDRTRESFDPQIPYFAEVVAIVGDYVRVSSGGTIGSGGQIVRAKGPGVVVGDRGVVIPTAGGGMAFVPVGGETLAPHTHDDRYYTEAEVDSKINALPSGPVGMTTAGRTASFRNSFSVGPLSNMSITANRVYFIPIYISEVETLSGVRFNLTTSPATSGAAHAGLYTASKILLPSTRVAIGSLLMASAAATGFYTVPITDTTVGAGWYYAALGFEMAVGVSGTSVAGAAPAVRGGVDINFVGYSMCVQTMSTGWTAVPSPTSVTSGPGNWYLDFAFTI